MATDVKAVTLSCAKCADVFVVDVPAHWPEANGFRNEHILCDSCRSEGWFGFVYAPIGLLTRLLGRAYGFLESAMQTLLRKR